MLINRIGTCAVIALLHVAACSGSSPQPSTGDSSIGGTNSAGGDASTGGLPQAGGSGSTGGALATGGSQNVGGQATGGTSMNGTANSTGGSGVCDGTPTLGTVSPAALQTELSQSTRSFLLINVHTPLAGNIPGTDADLVYTNVPAIEAFIGTDKTKPVVIYCMSDHMATIAGPQLVTDGYCSVRYVSGGLGAWEAAGYPVNP